MITKIEIARFKCFENQPINMGNLTLLAGANATGKSTVLQALLLLWQSYTSGNLKQGRLILNGRLVNIGTVSDAFNVNSSEETIKFSIQDSLSNVPISFEFQYPENRPDALSLTKNISFSGNWSRLLRRQLIYFSAERNGPRLLHPILDSHLRYLNFGIHGEFAISYFLEYKDTTIPNKNLKCPDQENLSLRSQTEFWMRKIVPDVGFDVQRIAQADQGSLGIRNRNTDNYLRPTNIGFGISYILPIVVACLIAPPKKSIIIVENPEAHLHPAGQSEMGKFLAKVAATGVQVIIETHSDHLFNGVRLAVKNKYVSADDVKIQFFTNDAKGVNVTSPIIDTDGSIDEWPNGFFDQTEKDLLELS